jgi:hypothetical protein
MNRRSIAFDAANAYAKDWIVPRWGKRGPSTGVRISAKPQRSPLVLSSEQVKLGLAELEFRHQLLVFLEGALGIRQGELGALRLLFRSNPQPAVSQSVQVHT